MLGLLLILQVFELRSQYPSLFSQLPSTLQAVRNHLSKHTPDVVALNISRDADLLFLGEMHIIRQIVQMVSDQLRAAANERQKTLNKCETRNKTVFHTRLSHPETINSVPLNSVLRIKQTGV